MRRPVLIWVMLPLLTGCLSVCPDAKDREAKQRLFSMDEPSPIEQAAAESIDSGVLHRCEETRQRVLWMSAAEVSERLRSFTAETDISFTWRRDGESVRLSEEARLAVADSGDFKVVIDNDHDFGMELRWIGGTSFVKSRQGTFRERRADRAGHESWREESLGALRALLELADGRVGFAPTGNAVHEGRQVVRYAVTNDADRDAAAAPPPRPSWAKDPTYPEDGPDEALLHRLAPFERGEPTRIAGEIWVDVQTAAIVRADLTSVFQVPPPEDEDGPPARLDLTIDQRLSEIGRPMVIDVPEHQPFERRPRAVKDPLDWWPPYVAERDDKAEEAAEPAEPETTPPTDTVPPPEPAD